MEWDIILLALTLVIAGFVHGVAGFGFPLLATTAIALVLDLTSAVIITLLPTLIINICSLLYGGKIIRLLQDYKYIIFFSGLGSLIGASSLLWLNQEFLKLLLVACILIYLLSNSNGKPVKIKENEPFLFALFMGISAGIMGGAANAMSPLLLIYLLKVSPSTRQTIQVANICFLLAKFSQAGILFTDPAFFDFSLTVIGGSLLLALLGMAAGFALQKHVSDTLYRKGIKLLLTGMMLTLAIQSIRNLIN